MKKVIKIALIKLRPLLNVFIGLFYNKKYLKSEYFEQDVMGYVWSLRSIWVKNILRLERPMPFPTCLTCHISNPDNIHFHPDDLDNFQSFGTYFQNFKGHIFIGKGSYIAPNVGIITANHKLDNIDEHDDGKDVYLGEKCWIGMNSVILPGVTLGDNTIVGAGSVVTKSFPHGNVVIAGVPAKIIRNIIM